MDKNIYNVVGRFFERYPQAATLGRVTETAEIDRLGKRIQKAIPKWYKYLLLQYPIADLPLGIPHDFGQPLLKGRGFQDLPLMEITFHSADKISEFSKSTFPNYLLFRKKIVGIAEDYGSTGEQIFIDARRDDPPVVLVVHDMGKSIDELMDNGIQLASSFTDLFAFGKLTNNRIKLNNANREVAVRLIEEFFDLIDGEIKASGSDLVASLADPQRLIEGIDQRNIKVNNDNYISGLLALEYGLYDSGYPLARRHLDKLVAIYDVCNLHVPELVHIEERVNNNYANGGSITR